MQNTDPQSLEFLNKISEQGKVKAQIVPQVQSVLVVLSTSGMVYDPPALSQKIKSVYPLANVYFISTSGDGMGAAAPSKVDLLIDFSGPGQRGPFLLPRKLRARARVTIGRKAGLWRPFIYDRLLDESQFKDHLPKEILARERILQRALLALAGIALTQTGEPLPDLGYSIALDLPPLKALS